MAERTLLRNGRVLTCAGDPTSGPQTATCSSRETGSPGVAGPPRRRPGRGPRGRPRAAPPCCPGLSDAHTHISWPLDFVFDHDGVARRARSAHILDVAAVARTFLESGYTLIIGAGVLQPDDDVLAKDFIDRGLIARPAHRPERGDGHRAGRRSGADGGLMEVVADAGQMRDDRGPPVRRRRAGAQAVHLRRRHRAASSRPRTPT